MDKKAFAIAIDGPVAAGKGTIAQKVAQSLHAFHLYTGAMYRSLSLFCLDKGIDFTDEEAVVGAVAGVTIVFQNDAVLVNGNDVTNRLQTQDVANGASLIATFPKVREQMVRKQQQLAQEAMNNGTIVVSEGRDTGTRVFPDAPLKVYLTASAEIRANRRLLQYRDQGRDVSLEEVLAEVQARDKRDTGRSADPLPNNPAELGYFVLDDSTLSEEQTVGAIIEELKKRNLL